LKPPDFDYGTVITALAESVRRNLSEGLLLSGGLDTVLIAYLAVKWGKPRCITVALRNAPAPDVEYARMVADRLDLSHYVHYFADDELYEGIQAAIRIMKTFDPMEVRNSAAIYVALKVARNRNIATVMTGDGCDELFGGYSFLFGLRGEQLDTALQKMWTNMRFSSEFIAEDLGVTVRLPYLNPQFRAWATALDSGLKIRNEKGEVWGKWILRRAFQNMVPPELLWRPKAPIEVGTGTTTLPSLFDSRIPNPEFAEKKARYLNEDRVTIRSKEHLYYYEIYRGMIGVPSAQVINNKACPDCGSNAAKEATFCRVCGAYPI